MSAFSADPEAPITCADDNRLRRQAHALASRARAIDIADGEDQTLDAFATIIDRRLQSARTRPDRRHEFDRDIARLYDSQRDIIVCSD